MHINNYYNQLELLPARLTAVHVVANFGKFSNISAVRDFETNIFKIETETASCHCYSGYVETLFLKMSHSLQNFHKCSIVVILKLLDTWYISSFLGHLANHQQIVLQK